MRKLLIIALLFISFSGSAQIYQTLPQYGYTTGRFKVSDLLWIPSDTTVNKTGIARIGSTLYAGNGTKWTAAAGSGTTGIDSVTITSTGCVKTFSTWSGGTESVIGTVTQPNGLAPGTGIATKTTGTTFTVTAATYTINCITYQSRDTTITLTAAGDTGRIDVIKVNTSGVTTQGTGTEGEALALPSLSATELALTYVLVTDTGVTVSLPTDTALWVSVGTSIRNANTGPVNVRTHLQIGTYTPGSWLTSGAHTNTYFVAQDGFFTTNPASSSLTKNGIAQGFGNAINMWAGSNIVGVWKLIGNNTGNQLSILGGYNPASGGGFVSTYSSNTTLNPTGANSINYTVFDANPTYTQGVLGTGALRGFWYRPSVASLNTSRNIAIETMSGDIIHRNLAGSGTRMVVANDSGLLSTQAIPGGGGGAQNLQDVTDLDSATTHAIVINGATVFYEPTKLVLQFGNLAAALNTGDNIIAIGDQSAFINTGTDVISIGYTAGATNAGTSVYGIGTGAAFANTGDWVNAIGYQSAQNNTGDEVNALGKSAASSNAAQYVNAFGVQAGQGNAVTGTFLNAIGFVAAQNNTGENVNAIGTAAAGVGTNPQSGNNVNAFGSFALSGNSGNNVNAFGAGAGGVDNTWSNINVFGAAATADSSSQVVFNNEVANLRLDYGAVASNQKLRVRNLSGTIALLSDITTSTSDTIYVDAPLEAYTSGDSNKIRINPDTLAAWRPKYKVYTALLNQVGTDAPVATVLENTLGASIVWTRFGAGSYRGTLTGAFPAGKTWCMLNSTDDAADVGYYSLKRFDDDTCILDAFDTSVTPVDDILINTAIEIRVYY